jgi:hypothetical protein
LFDWVAYPVSLLIDAIYRIEMKTISKNIKPCPFRLELLASLERMLAFCHMGNTAVLATRLMNPLGLSRAAVKDGFPMLLKLFSQPTVASAMTHGLVIDPGNWPCDKDGYPAIASKGAQVHTYSINHFMVRLT